jgi:hypothetical protein
MTDEQFVDFAGQTDMVEINLGQLAQNSASSQAVKDYAQMLVTPSTQPWCLPRRVRNLRSPYASLYHVARIVERV